ncbi:PilZ domain-containing protein [Roseibium sp. RKSG952]|uniref:PilZ domain-containing protein n=1 Tax=Roseibium sp. RKSG952 TaxID=2529384 RepID=UPI0012BBD5D3|nr:PilZ domain-containing protein [Roseibium sp. RKSG952]MTH95244.1 PilZ domain-containing protein [Roseibium sp. RKSG952]
MDSLAHLQDKDGARETVLVFDPEKLLCISGVLGSVSQWGGQLASGDIHMLGKTIALRIGDEPRLVKAEIMAVKKDTAAIIFTIKTQPVANKRMERRNDVSMPVSITDGSGQIEISGTIVDAGENGCRIVAEGLGSLPEHVLLNLPRFKGPLRGQFAWRTQTSGGLKLDWSEVSS